MKIVIVDDEEVSLFITKRKLVLEGLALDKDIHTFLSGQEALEMLAACAEGEYPDIVLVDLSMPNMDGWQFLELLAQAGSGLADASRIYILTSSLAMEDRTRAREVSLLAGYILKPISAESIRMLREGHTPGSPLSEEG